MGDVTREKAKAAAAEMGRLDLWRVLRHGGRRNNAWRDAGAWAPGDAYGEGCAKDTFKTIKIDLRQGGVALANPAGEVIDFASAPLLRTRW